MRVHSDAENPTVSFAQGPIPGSGRRSGSDNSLSHVGSGNSVSSRRRSLSVEMRCPSPARLQAPRGAQQCSTPAVCPTRCRNDSRLSWRSRSSDSHVPYFQIGGPGISGCISQRRGAIRQRARIPAGSMPTETRRPERRSPQDVKTAGASCFDQARQRCAQNRSASNWQCFRCWRPCRLSIGIQETGLNSTPLCIACQPDSAQRPPYPHHESSARG